MGKVIELAASYLQRLDPVVDALKRGLGQGLVALVLFGSRARREGKGYSDWDLFLIAEGLPENAFDRQLALRVLLPREPGMISLVPKTREEFEVGFPPLYLDLAMDGIVLYDPQGYMKAKLELIRGIIRRTGLKRARRQGALVWNWREKPQGRWRIDWSGLHGFEGGGTV